MKPLEIKGARTRLGYRQKYMADQLGISVTSYSKKENGVVRFTDDEKVKMAEILHFSLKEMNDYFFDGKLPIGR